MSKVFFFPGMVAICFRTISLEKDAHSVFAFILTRAKKKVLTPLTRYVVQVATQISCKLGFCMKGKKKIIQKGSIHQVLLLALTLVHIHLSVFKHLLASHHLSSLLFLIVGNF